MKNGLITLIFFCGIFFVTCCNRIGNYVLLPSDAATTIDVSKTLSSDLYLNLDDIIDSIQVIRLETNDESVLSRIKKIIIGDECIYIRDSYRNGSVAIFDRNGSFVKRISIGQGPKETYRVTDITYDYFSKHLIVASPGKINKYDSRGDYLNSYSCSFPYINIGSFNNGYVFSAFELTNGEKAFLDIVSVDSSFSVNKSLQLGEDYIAKIGYSHFSNSTDNSLLIFRSYYNAVWAYKDDTLSVKYILDLGDKQFNVSPYSDYESFDKEFVGDNYLFSGLLAETDNYISMRFDKPDHESCYVYYNKPASRFRSGGMIPFTLKSYLVKGQFAGSYGNYFVKYIQYEDLLSGEDRQKLFANRVGISDSVYSILSNHTPDDNPLIILYRLKDIPAESDTE